MNQKLPEYDLELISKSADICKVSLCTSPLTSINISILAQCQPKYAKFYSTFDISLFRRDIGHTNKTDNTDNLIPFKYI